MTSGSLYDDLFKEDNIPCSACLDDEDGTNLNSIPMEEKILSMYCWTLFEFTVEYLSRYINSLQFFKRWDSFSLGEEDSLIDQIYLNMVI